MTRNLCLARRGWLLVALVIAAAAASPSAAVAASSTGSIELIGTVPVHCEVTIGNVDGTLDLVAGESAKPVADIVETYNEPAGYTITLASGNAGDLVSQDGIRVDYRVDYDTAANHDLAVDLVLVRNQARFDFVRPLRVTVAADSERLAGSYSDIITVTVTAR